jgi:phospholipase/carboxylesterase
LIGFSQGAILSWALGINYAGKINKLVLLSGYFNDELINNASVQLKELKCFISHGIYDQVIPIKLARDSIKKIEKYNFNYDFNEYPETHGVSSQNLNDIIEWLSP